MKTAAAEIEIKTTWEVDHKIKPWSRPWKFMPDLNTMDCSGWMVDASGRPLGYGTKEEFEEIMNLVNSTHP